VKKFLLLFIMGMVFLFPCFSQNMLILGGEYNPFFGPEYWNAGAAFNLQIKSQYLQNEFMVNFGGTKAEDKTGSPAQKFSLSFRDNLFLSLNWKWVGLRLGVLASLGIYDFSDIPDTFNLLLYPGAFAGICILPQSLISVTLDVCPGYALHIHWSDELTLARKGFILPLSLGIRLNLDKL
jgi:hypothetical protein